jgi:hypothetical protein
MIWQLEWEDSPAFPFTLPENNAPIEKIQLNKKSNCIYSAADGSIQEIRWLSGFNQLPMEPFYMQLFECRRLLPPGGKILIQSIGGSGGAERKKIYDLICKFRSKQYGFEPRPIHDYISPEDWQETFFQQVKKQGWIFEIWQASRI